MTKFLPRLNTFIITILLIVQMPIIGWAAQGEGADRVSANLTHQAPAISRSSEHLLTGMPFKLGLEFQEGSNLCPWALNNNYFQKKPFFFIREGETKRRLWKLVIDTNDIEFVTEPFSYEEPQYLSKCIDSIVIAIEGLQQILKHQNSVTIEDWLDHVETSLNSKSFYIGYFGRYHSVRYQPLLKKQPAEDEPIAEWKPIFVPQVTIQYPLEHTIPLYSGLFGFESRRYMLPFISSLPYLDLLIAAQKGPVSRVYYEILRDYRKKISGLIFLHALTLFQMAPIDDMSDKLFLNETSVDLEKYHQIDPKMKLPVMSRRPFSSMFKDLKLGSDYKSLFWQCMDQNYRFKGGTNHFQKVNYAEQFFDPRSGQPKSLKSSFMPLLHPTFMRENTVVLERLLDQGVISTAMIRNFISTIMTIGEDSQFVSNLCKTQLTASINTVDIPGRRYIISFETPGIQSVQSTVDSVSPPWFLDDENSMGRLKQDLTEEEQRYGEGIVEVRAIKNVQPWFLKQIGLTPTNVEDGIIYYGDFLTSPTSRLKTETEALFNFLRRLGTQEEFFDDINLGIGNALYKFERK